MRDSNYYQWKFLSALIDAVVEDDNCEEQGRYPYIPANPRLVDAGIGIAKAIIQHLNPTNTKISFLDAGCGIGDKVLIAKNHGLDAYGIELCKKSLTVARVLLGQNHIFNTNLLTYRNYHKYDIIYLYRPLCDSKLEQEFESRLLDTAKSDVIIVSAGDDGFQSKLQNLTKEPFYPKMTRKLKHTAADIDHYRLLVRPQLAQRLAEDFAVCTHCQE